MKRFQGDEVYSFVFDGLPGYLDHALASPSFAPRVRGVAAWHINSDESALLDYDDAVVDAGEASFEAKPVGTTLFDGASPARSSDHDPVVIAIAAPEPRSLVSRCVLVAVLATLLLWRRLRRRPAEGSQGLVAGPGPRP